ncbi:MAG: LysR family transcriptional regulator [Ralstonia sp.]|nr:LysR family transcriptional regulator [Ralstonia sp.]
MRLRHIEIFHTVMQTGSISGAAAQLNLSQSAASKALAQAEHALGLQLFRRVQGRLVRTREAEQLYSRTVHLFAEVDQVRQLARNLSRSPEAHLRVGCLPSLGLSLVPRAVQNFHTRYLGATIEVVTQNGDELMASLLARDIDIAVCFDLAGRPGVSKVALGAIQVVHMSMDPESNGEALDLESLDAAGWISIGGQDPLAKQIRARWPGANESKLPPRIETRTYYVAAALARQGVGFALVDELTAHAIGAGMTIRPLQPPIALGAVALHLASDVSFHAQEAFLDALRQSVVALTAASG